ncbi:MAG: exodeoxyribonuclease III [Kiloniellales bacterium]|nr:exodeoxyribonuclease III [Kiloniellales bacterium]
METDGGMITVATWNVNSIKVRIETVLAWLKAKEPDVLLLQELKCQEEGFPRLEFEAAGYGAAVVGQKSYNGVAVLSKHPAETVAERLPGDDDDDQARYLEVETAGIRVASIYLPNGNPVDSEKFPYKLSWMDRLAEHAAGLLASERAIVLGGDYNVIPAAADCYDPAAWANDALYRLETRQRFRRLINQGWTEAFRALHPGLRRYSFWDYQGGAWQNDLGIRIDHLLLSPQAADRLQSCEIDREPRGKKKASDHTPVLCTLTA